MIRGAHIWRYSNAMIASTRNVQLRVVLELNNAKHNKKLALYLVGRPISNEQTTSNVRRHWYIARIRSSLKDGSFTSVSFPIHEIETVPDVKAIAYPPFSSNILEKKRREDMQKEHWRYCGFDGCRPCDGSYGCPPTSDDWRTAHLCTYRGRHSLPWKWVGRQDDVATIAWAIRRVPWGRCKASML